MLVGKQEEHLDYVNCLNKIIKYHNLHAKVKLFAAETVIDGVTGLHVVPCDYKDLVAKIEYALSILNTI